MKIMGITRRCSNPELFHFLKGQTMEEEELLECAEKDLERSFHNYQCGCQTKEGFLEFLSQAYFRGMGEINKKFGGTERSSPEYKETVRKLRDLFCCNEEYFAPWPQDIESPLSGSLYTLKIVIPEEYMEAGDLSGRNLVLHFTGIHIKDKTEPFYVHVDEKRKGAMLTPGLYKTEYEAHGYFEGYDNAGMTMNIPLKNERTFMICWKCYPDYGHKRWKPMHEYARTRAVPMFSLERLTESIRQKSSSEKL